MNRAIPRPTDNLDPVEEELHNLALAALQNSNRLADFYSGAEWHFNRFRISKNSGDLEHVRQALHTFADNLAQLQRQTKHLENMLNRAAARWVKE